MKPEPPALGVDFGGTQVKLGLVSPAGGILARRAFDTTAVSGVAAWIEAVARALADMGVDPAQAGACLAGIGVGVPGFTDFGNGFIHELTNVPGWVAVPLGEKLRARFGVPARVDNDANAMALGECRHGAGRDYRHAVFVTLGTGVGGGLLLDGRLYRGAHSMAGEIGHLSIDGHGRASPQGRGGLEQYVGNRRIVEDAVEALRAVRPSSLPGRVGGNFAALTPRLIAEEAAKGDELSRAVFDRVADALATAFASLTYVLQPEAFIVGGGVSQAGDVLFVPLRRHLAERLSPHFDRLIHVRPAQLGPEAGLIGAASLVWE